MVFAGVMFNYITMKKLYSVTLVYGCDGTYECGIIEYEINPIILSI